jgi:hypothetical protein
MAPILAISFGRIFGQLRCGLWRLIFDGLLRLPTPNEFQTVGGL